MDTLNEVGCASVPSAGLAALADLRCRRDVEAAIVVERVWLRWPAGDEEMPHRVLAVSGAELYIQRRGRWFRFGSRLLSPGWPPGAVAEPLHCLVTPEFPEPESVHDAPPRRCALTLVRNPHPHPATAMRCELSALAAWAERATTIELSAVAGVRLADDVVLCGRNLPMLPGARRFWGERVLAPLGYRAEPALPENALLAALDAADETTALLDFAGVELLPLHVFQPLTRAGVRLALMERD